MKKLREMKVPHVFTLLTAVILLTSIATWFVPSGSYQREVREVGGLTRNVVVPGSFVATEKHRSLKGAVIGEEAKGKSSPVSVVQFLSAIPRGMEAAADIIFFIFVIGGVFSIIQNTGTVVALLHALLAKFGSSGPLLTVLLMVACAVGGSTLGMGEEFIPLVPIFILVSREMGYDRIYGLALVMLAADVGFAAATTNPFTVNIAQGIAELPLNSALGFRITFLGTILVVAIAYVLRYGAKIKKDPTQSILYNDGIELDFEHEVGDVELNASHLGILASCIAIFAFILWAVQSIGWWLPEMAGGFIAMGLIAIVISKMSLEDAAQSFAKGMEEMVVAALVVGFARGIQVVAEDANILDTLIHSAAGVLGGFPTYVAAQGMLVFQTTLNFFIPSGSGQAAVTMPLMAPLADVLGLTRQTAVFAFTCGDGFSNTIIPTSGVLMAMLSLAKIPYEKWLRFMLPLFGILMLISMVFLSIAVAIQL